jgi:hypothetical protein
MAKPVWQQKLAASLENNPLYWFTPVDGTYAKVVCAHHHSASPGKKGKKLSLREVVNYNNHRCTHPGCTVEHH